MKKRNRKDFIISFLKEVEKLDICNSYKYLADDLKDLFLNNKEELRSNLKNARNWEHFIFEIEESLNSFIYEQEIISYKVACDFLAKFDPSFRVGFKEAENEDWTFSAL